ncbi:hypothetical protein RHS01_01094 [Rhizoctonia solani]|uniref:PRKR-interacting protein 1 n=1 Tax=Rhizoctonia solani TaxID=456999 RepID=A0A8H7IMV6_9AGAM|nr:hypothetical protein RHS01_01094 [Rhizoctonia solani]
MATGTPPPVSNATQSGEAARKKQTALDLQKQQLEKLMKDPTKLVNLPAPPKRKHTGAGSGEFHVYKQSRRREYERLKIMEEASKKEQEAAEFEAKKREREEQSEAKTAKNRARRQKKKNRAMGKGGVQDGTNGNSEDPTKRRRLAADGANVVFRRPGESSDEEDEHGPTPAIPQPTSVEDSGLPTLPPDVKVAEPTQIIIHDD